MRSGRGTDAGTWTAVALAVLAVGVIAAAAWVLADAQADQRKEVRTRYAERSRIATSLVDALFRVAFGPQAQQATERYGRLEEVPTRLLDQQVAAGNLAYIAILDAEGRLVAASSKAPAGTEARLSARPPHVRRGVRGPYGLSDVIEGKPPVVETAIAFDSSAGKRILVNGTPAPAFEEFLGGTLRPVPGAGGQGFVLDGAGRPLASVSARGPSRPSPELVDATSGERTGRFELDGADQFFSAEVVPSSRWRIVSTISDKRLYAGIGGTSRWLPWVLLGLGALALMAIGLLARRLVQSAGQERRTNERLEVSQQRLEERAAELERSNADLEQFAYAASHDLSEPLRTVAGFSQLLARRYKGQLDADADEIVHHMNNGVERMQQLIDDLLLYSRVGRAPLSDDEVDLDDVLAQVRAWLAPMIEEREAEITVDSLPTVRGESGQLAQVLQNLLANAIKFTAPGVRPRVHVGSAREGADAWRITVSDNGIGVDADQEVIFRMFGRLHPADTYPGTGIGLALARRIVDRHGGRIWVEPNPDGQGSTFCFTVPDRASVREPVSVTP